MFNKTASLLMVSTALAAGAAMAQTTPMSPATPATPAPMSTPAPVPSTAAPSTTSATPSGTSSATNFVTDQGTGEFRVSKFVGVDVYGAENQKIGDINEILMDANGSAKTVIIGVGGFLGIGQKNVAVPFSAIEWKLQPMVTASAPAMPAPGTVTGGPLTTASTVPARSPAETAAYNGYPDHGLVKMTKAELQDAPTFKYYADTHSASGAPSNAVTSPVTTTPRQ